MAGTTYRYTVSGDRWVELSGMTGRDFLRFREILSRRPAITDADVEWVIRTLGDRAVASSEEDPLAIEQIELFDVAFRWYSGVEDDAVPPETGTE